MTPRGDAREAAIRQVEHFCEQQTGEEMRLEVEAKASKLTIVERRPPWNPDFGSEWSRQAIAELRDDKGMWSLYWPRHTGRWQRYEDLPPAADVGPLLTEIEADPHGVFWG